MNPVRAAMVDDPAHYRWTPYRANALGQFSPRLSPHPVYLALGQADNATRRLPRFVPTPSRSGDHPRSTELALIPSQPLGNERFYAEIERMTGQRREARPRGRPPLDTNVAGTPDAKALVMVTAEMGFLGSNKITGRMSFEITGPAGFTTVVGADEVSRGQPEGGPERKGPGDGGRFRAARPVWNLHVHGQAQVRQSRLQWQHHNLLEQRDHRRPRPSWSSNSPTPRRAMRYTSPGTSGALPKRSVASRWSPSRSKPP